jgi:hypothetical protein
MDTPLGKFKFKFTRWPQLLQLVARFLDAAGVGSLSLACRTHKTQLAQALAAAQETWPFVFVYTQSYGGFGLGPVSRQHAEPEPPGEHSCHGDYREPDVGYRNRVAWAVKRWPEDNKGLRFGAVRGVFRKCVHISQYDGSESYFVKYGDALLDQARVWDAQDEEAGHEPDDAELVRRYRELQRIAAMIPTHRMHDRSMFGNLVWSEFEDPEMVEHAHRLNRELVALTQAEEARERDRMRQEWGTLEDWLASKNTEQKGSEPATAETLSETPDVQPDRAWTVVTRKARKPKLKPKPKPRQYAAPRKPRERV